MSKLHTEKQEQYWRDIVKNHHIPSVGVEAVLTTAAVNAILADRDIRMLHERIVSLEKEIKKLKSKK